MPVQAFETIVTPFSLTKPSEKEAPVGSKVCDQKKPKVFSTCGMEAAASSNLIISPALCVAAGTQCWAVRMRPPLSSLWPTRMLPVALASLPTMTVEQAEALKAMEPMAAPIARTASLVLKFI